MQSPANWKLQVTVLAKGVLLQLVDYAFVPTASEPVEAVDSNKLLGCSYFV